MYEDKEKRKKVFIESNCVSRDDCCWDETPELIEAVAVNKIVHKIIQTQPGSLVHATVI